MARVVIHAGFHKTGTTSIQRALQDAELPLQVIVRRDMVALCEAARAYSQSRSALDLGFVRYEAAELATRIEGDTLITSEDLAGHMPGRRGLTRYDATPRLMQALTETWRAARPDDDLHLAFTTRAAAPWLRSCHMQHLRATRMTQSSEDYARDYAASADLNGVIEAVRAGCACPVHGFALEDAPLSALLHLAGVPEPAHPAMPHRNPSADDRIRAEILAINRSDLSDADARAARKAAFERARGAG